MGLFLLILSTFLCRSLWKALVLHPSSFSKALRRFETSLTDIHMSGDKIFRIFFSCILLQVPLCAPQDHSYELDRRCISILGFAKETTCSYGSKLSWWADFAGTACYTSSFSVHETQVSVHSRLSYARWESSIFLLKTSRGQLEVVRIDWALETASGWTSVIDS